MLFTINPVSMLARSQKKIVSNLFASEMLKEEKLIDQQQGDKIYILIKK